MAEDNDPQPEAPKRPRLAWSRGRWALLALVALAFGHWYVSRRSATETAARLHGAASTFAACIVAARPPDPGSPEAKRGLEAMLFKRLALSLSKAKPLEPCAPLASAVKAQAKIHKDNFYHRSPNEVETIWTIATRLAELDYSQDAAHWSKKPSDAGRSLTLELLADTHRLLELACKVAQAEKAYDVGACPLTGEAARGVPDPRVALEVSLGEPITDYQMTLTATPAPRLVVAARGRRGKFGAWIAGASAQAGSAASWRTLSLTLQGGAAPPPGPELPRIDLVTSWNDLRVVESFSSAGRAFTVDGNLLKATSALSVDADLATSGHSQPTAAAGARLVPLTANTFAWIPPATAEGSPRVVQYYDAQGKLLDARELTGRIFAATLNPARLFVRASGSIQATPLEPTASPASSRIPAQPLPDDFNLVESHDACGNAQATALLARSSEAAWLQVYPTNDAKPVSTEWRLPPGTRPKLVCGACAPRILEVTKGQLALREPHEPSQAQAVDSPVLFGANSALRTEATCIDRTTLLAYVVGGALLIQRVTPEGSEAPVEVARPGEQGNTARPQLLLLPAEAGAPPRVTVFWRRAGGKTRSDLLRVEFAESADLGKTWH